MRGASRIVRRRAGVGDGAIDIRTDAPRRRRTAMGAARADCRRRLVDRVDAARRRRERHAHLLERRHHRRTLRRRRRRGLWFWRRRTVGCGASSPADRAPTHPRRVDAPPWRSLRGTARVPRRIRGSGLRDHGRDERPVALPRPADDRHPRIGATGRPDRPDVARPRREAGGDHAARRSYGERL